MSEEKEKEPRKVRLMSRHDFKTIRKLRQSLTDKQKALKDWTDTICDRENWWPKDWTLRSGQVDPDTKLRAAVAQIKDPALRATLLTDLQKTGDKSKRASTEDTAEARERLDIIDSVIEKLENAIVDVAFAYGVPINALNLDTGEIEDVDVTEEKEALKPDKDKK